MKNLILILSLSFSVAGCDKLIERDDFPAIEPSPEELAIEIKSAPKATDGPSVNRAVVKTTVDRHLKDRLHEDLSDLGYELVIFIDKSVGGQTLTVLRKGKEVFSFLTSTGAEVPKENRLGAISRRHTPTGFFRPMRGRLYVEYHSRTWDAEMPYAIFFSVPVPIKTSNGKDDDIAGYAVHATKPELYRYLGTRASGGCARLEYDHAEALFDLVKNQVGTGKVAQFHRDGRIVKNANGEIEYVQGYRTLIVINDGPL